MNKTIKTHRDGSWYVSGQEYSQNIPYEEWIKDLNPGAAHPPAMKPVSPDFQGD